MTIRGSPGQQAHPSTVGERDGPAREQRLEHFLDEKRIPIREEREQELALDILREQAEMGKYGYTRCEW